jgi:hypothetical protein
LAQHPIEGGFLANFPPVHVVVDEFGLAGLRILQARIGITPHDADRNDLAVRCAFEHHFEAERGVELGRDRGRFVKQRGIGLIAMARGDIGIVDLLGFFDRVGSGVQDMGASHPDLRLRR